MTSLNIDPSNIQWKECNYLPEVCFSFGVLHACICLMKQALIAIQWIPEVLVNIASVPGEYNKASDATGNGDRSALILHKHSGRIGAVPSALRGSVQRKPDEH